MLCIVIINFLIMIKAEQLHITTSLFYDKQQKIATQDI